MNQIVNLHATNVLKNCGQPNTYLQTGKWKLQLNSHWLCREPTKRKENQTENKHPVKDACLYPFLKHLRPRQLLEFHHDVTYVQPCYNHVVPIFSLWWALWHFCSAHGDPVARLTWHFKGPSKSLYSFSHGCAADGLTGGLCPTAA